MSITHNLAASSARHSTHHRGDAVPDETTDLLSALANRLRHCGSLDGAACDRRNTIGFSKVC